MPFLEHDGTTRELAPGEMLVGSGSQAAWRLASADLAARHFSLAVAPDGAATLRPYSPQNVVVVNGRQVPAAGVTLASGDRVAAGSAAFHYLDTVGAPRAAAPAAGRALLLHDTTRTAYSLKKRTLTIGRDAASTVLVRDPEVSRFHADVRAEAGEFVVYASGASGTQVNGQTVGAPRLLEEGDEVRVGSTALRFTRRTAPVGFTVTEGAETADDKATRRDTMVAGSAVTGEMSKLASARRPVVPIAAAAMVAVGAVIWFVAR